MLNIPPPPFACEFWKLTTPHFPNHLQCLPNLHFIVQLQTLHIPTFQSTYIVCLLPSLHFPVYLESFPLIWCPAPLKILAPPVPQFGFYAEETWMKGVKTQAAPQYPKAGLRSIAPNWAPC